MIGNGIEVTLESKKRRSISESEVQNFCEVFSRTNSRKTTSYSEIYRNSSYLLTINDYLNSDEFKLAEEVSDSEERVEGKHRRILVNRYERDPILRRLCVELQGTICKVCNTDLIDIYGDEVRGLIHVHHLKPISEAGGPQSINPEKDLAPVCPNCHAVIHHGGSCRGLDQVKLMIRNSSRK